jgi:hypothetical protein
MIGYVVIRYRNLGQTSDLLRDDESGEVRIFATKQEATDVARRCAPSKVEPLHSNYITKGSDEWPTCACGHMWQRHQQDSDGNWSCRQYGCDCRNVIPLLRERTWEVW